MPLELGELRVVIGADISQLRRGLTEAKAEIQALQDALKNSQSASAGISAAVAPMQQMEQATAHAAGSMRLFTAYFIGRQVFDVFKQGLESAAQFNDEMARVAITAGMTKEGIDKLSSSVLAVAGETGIGPQKLADAMFLVSEASKDASQNVAMLTTIAQAARLGLTDMKATTDFLLDFATSFGDASEVGVKRAADLAFAAQSLGRLPFREQAVRLGPQAAIAAEAGLTPEEFLASATGATQAGLQPNQIGQAQQALFRAFLKPNPQMAEALASIGTQLAEQGKLKGPDVDRVMQHQRQLEALRKQLNTVKPGKETSDVVQLMKDEQKTIEESAGPLGKAIVQTLGFKGALDQLKATVGGNVTELEKMFQRTTSVALIQYLTGKGTEKYTEDLKKLNEAAGTSDEVWQKNAESLNTASQNAAKFAAGFSAAATSMWRSVLENLFATPEKFPGRAQPKMQFGLVKSIIDEFRNFRFGGIPELDRTVYQREHLAFRQSEIAESNPLYGPPVVNAPETEEDRRRRRNGGGGGEPPGGGPEVGPPGAAAEDIAAQGLGFDTLRRLWEKMRQAHKETQDGLQSNTVRTWTEMRYTAVNSAEDIDVNVSRSSLTTARNVAGAYEAMQGAVEDNLGLMQVAANRHAITVPVNIGAYPPLPQPPTVAIPLQLTPATATLLGEMGSAISELQLWATIKEKAINLTIQLLPKASELVADLTVTIKMLQLFATIEEQAINLLIGFLPSVDDLRANLGGTIGALQAFASQHPITVIQQIQQQVIPAPTPTPAPGLTPTPEPTPAPGVLPNAYPPIPAFPPEAPPGVVPAPDFNLPPTPNMPYMPGGPHVWLPFAEGGIVTRPTAGIVGEAGPEAVIPLSRGIGGTTNHINITVNGAKDPATVAQEIVWLLKRKGIKLA